MPLSTFLWWSWQQQLLLCLALVILWSPLLCHAQFSSPTNFHPSTYPLAVRSPYLNTWIKTQNGTTSLNNWPTHWDLQNINGWSGWVRVDGNPFIWLGNPPGGNNTVVQVAQVTPTRSMFLVTAGPVSLNITFLSPIETGDLVKQSLPFTYLSVDVVSNDGQPHSVQLYSDISAEWISGVRSNAATWNTTQTAQSLFHQSHRQNPAAMQETNNIAEDGYVYYGMKSVPNMSWQSGPDLTCRGQFTSSGKLTGTQDTSFRAINDHFVVFAISVDLGTITATGSPVVWGLGLIRDPIIQFGTDFAGSQPRRAYFWTKYNTISDAIDDVLADYPNALQRASALDQQLVNTALATSSNYADLVSLGARQTMASIEFTVTPLTTKNGWNMSDVKAFMRDMGNTRRVNPVEMMYASMPALISFNATWLGMLLSPLMQYQASSLYKNDWAASDLGPSYPQALENGDTQNSNQGIEATADMLIMTWAYSSYTGNGDLISLYYKLLKKWADYLVTNTLDPSGQVVDGLTKPSMTNLALKGILGIRAFGAIANAAKQSDDAGVYTGSASNLAKSWAGKAFGSGHLLSTYSSTSSVALIYNLFVDHLFNFGVVDNSIYTAQTSFYQSLVGSAPRFGFPFDADGQTVKAHWLMFTAAFSTTPDLRNALIQMVWNRAGTNQTAGAFPTTYDDSSGNTLTPTTGGQASPAQGGMFAILALSIQNSTTINVPPFPSGSSPGGNSDGSNSNNGGDGGNADGSKPNVGVIAGATVGGFVIIGILAFLAVVLWRKKRENEERDYWVKPVPYSDGSRNGDGSTHQPSTNGHGNGNEYDAYDYHGAFVGRTPVMPPLPPSQSHQYQSQLPYSANQERYNWDGSEGAYSANRNSFATTTRSGARSGGTGENQELRSEVDHLRREMEEMRAHMQPPPLYGYSGGNG